MATPIANRALRLLFQMITVQYFVHCVLWEPLHLKKGALSVLNVLSLLIPQTSEHYSALNVPQVIILPP